MPAAPLRAVIYPFRGILPELLVGLIQAFSRRCAGALDTFGNPRIHAARRGARLTVSSANTPGTHHRPPPRTSGSRYAAPQPKRRHAVLGAVLLLLLPCPSARNCRLSCRAPGSVSSARIRKQLKREGFHAKRLVGPRHDSRPGRLHPAGPGGGAAGQHREPDARSHRPGPGGLRRRVPYRRR